MANCSAPSRFEGVPLVVLEAQRMGCAVIATDVGAVLEAIRHGEDGFLIPHRQTEEAVITGFTETLALLSADRALLAGVASAAAARLAKATWPARMQEFLNHLDRLVPVQGLPG